MSNSKFLGWEVGQEDMKENGNKRRNCSWLASLVACSAPFACPPPFNAQWAEAIKTIRQNDGKMESMMTSLSHLRNYTQEPILTEDSIKWSYISFLWFKPLE